MRIVYEASLIRAVAIQRDKIIYHSRIERMYKRELLRWYAKEDERYNNYLFRNLSPPRTELESYSSRDEGPVMNTANRKTGWLW